LQVLGDPANLLDDINSGVTTFLRKTKQEITGERVGVGAGVGDLAGGVFGGALGSISKISGSLKDTVGSVAGRPIASNARPKDLEEGITLALGCLAGGVTEAVNGLVVEPMEQATESGALGLFRGAALGAAGLVLRPVEGVLAAVEKIAEGAEGQVKGLRRGYNGLRRPPRVAFCDAGVNASCLRGLPPAFFWPEWNLRVVSVSLPGLWTERRVHSLALCLAAAEEQWSDSEDREVVIVRRADKDGWALQGSGADNALAVGRVGGLRGPFRLQVWAQTDSNLELGKPLRILAAEGCLPTAELEQALMRPLHERPLPLRFQVAAVPLPLGLNALAGAEEGAPVGEVCIELIPGGNSKIMPRRYMLPEDDAAGASQASTAAEEGGDGHGDEEGLPSIGPDSVATTASGFIC